MIVELEAVRPSFLHGDDTCRIFPELVVKPKISAMLNLNARPVYFEKLCQRNSIQNFFFELNFQSSNFYLLSLSKPTDLCVSKFLKV